MFSPGTINEYFSVELINPDISSFYIPAIKSNPLATGAFSGPLASAPEREWEIKTFVLWKSIILSIFFRLFYKNSYIIMFERWMVKSVWRGVSRSYIQHSLPQKYQIMKLILYNIVLYS